MRDNIIHIFKSFVKLIFKKFFIKNLFVHSYEILSISQIIFVYYFFTFVDYANSPSAFYYIKANPHRFLRADTALRYGFINNKKITVTNKDFIIIL